MTEKSLNSKRMLFIPTLLIIFSLMICIILGFGILTQIKKQILTYSSEIIDEQVVTIKTEFNGLFNTLEAYGNTLTISNLKEDSSFVQELLLCIIHNTSFSGTCLINKDGNSFYYNGTTADLSDRLYFRTALKDERNIELILGRQSGQTRFIMAVPIKYVNKVEKVLCGTLTTERFKNLLNPKSPNHIFESFMCDTNGNILVGNNKFDNEEIPANIFTTEKTNIFPIEEQNKIQYNMKKKSSGYISFYQNRNKKYALYSPIGISDLYIVNIVPESSLLSQVNTIRIRIFVVSFFVIFLGLILIIYLYFMNKNHQKQIYSERMFFATAVDQSNRFVFLYEPEIDKAHAIGQVEKYFEKNYLKNFRANLLKDNLIANESIVTFSEFSEELLKFSEKASCTIGISSQPNNSLTWVHCDATLITISKKSPCYIISFHDCNELREKELAYAKLRNDRDMLLNNSIAYTEVNLTQDRVELFSSIAHKKPDILLKVPYSVAVEKESSTQIFPEDVNRFLNFFDPKLLLSLYYDQIFELSFEYRSKITGEYEWYKATVKMVNYPYTDEVKAFINIVNINAEKIEQLSLEAKATKDPLTKISNRSTLEKEINNKLSEIQRNSFSALFMIDLDNFKKYNDTNGHQAGDALLIETAENLNKIFRQSDVIGRLGGDEFMIFCSNFSTEKQIVKKAEEIIKQLTFEFENLTVTASVGICFFKETETTFKNLYEQADKALYKAKSKGRNTYVISKMV